MADFSVASVAERLDQALRGIDNRRVAALLKERAGYETSHESVRRARKGLMQSIPHEMVAAVSEAFEADAGWLLTGAVTAEEAGRREAGEVAAGTTKTAPSGSRGRVSAEPLSDAERLQILRLLNAVERAVLGPTPIAEAVAKALEAVQIAGEAAARLHPQEDGELPNQRAGGE